MPHPHDVPRQTNLIFQINDLRRPKTHTDDGWVMVGDSTDEVSPAFQNGWGHANPSRPVSFFLDNDGVVRFRGEADGGTEGTVVFTLPEGYRPEFTMPFTGPGGVGDGISRIQVDPNGDVTITSVGATVTDESAIHSGDAVGGDLEGTLPNPTLDPGSNGFWKTVSGALTRVTTVAWSELTGIPSTFTPAPGSDGYWKTASGALTKLSTIPWGDLSSLPSRFKVGVRKNSAGSTYERDRLNFIEGSNVTITVADDATDGEIDITISSSGGGGSVATDTIYDAKGDLPVGTGADTSAKLSVGSNDTIPIADSTQTTGIRWGSIDGGGA